MKGRVELVEFPISETSPIVGLSLAEINKKYEFQILVCASSVVSRSIFRMVIL